MDSRYLVDVSTRDQTTTLFGRDYASPFGISPTGLAALFRPGADLMLAGAAKAANLPFVMSGAGTASIEELAKVAPEHGWYPDHRCNPVVQETTGRGDGVASRIPGRTASESAARHAMPRSESMPSKYPISNNRK